MAATINDRLDYFGTSVSVAEHLLDLAPAGGQALTPPVAADPQVASLLQSRGISGKVEPAELSGLNSGPSACLVIPERESPNK
jgi:hypothetical protein